jgi:hypothetical protein
MNHRNGIAWGPIPERPRQAAVAPLLERALFIGRRTVTLTLDGLQEDGSPVWRMRWFPAAPDRMPPDLIAEFDREMAAAKVALVAALHSAQEARHAQH